MNGAYYALIIPQAGPGAPTHPIAPGGHPPPLGIWGGGGVGNYPDAGFPGPQPGGPVHIWGGAPPYVDIGGPGPQPFPGRPTQPIYYPPGIWGGGNVPMPNPPIYMPPTRPPGIWGGGGVGNYPDAGFPGPQPGGPTHIWGGPWQPPYPSQGPGFPTNPIVIPPGDIPEGPVGDDEMVIVIFVPGIGYKMAVVPKPPEVPGYNPPTGPSTERPTPVQK